MPVWQLLGGKVRDRVKVYGWIGGDKPSDVVAGAAARRAQGFAAVKMNGTDGVDWIDSPAVLAETVARVRDVREEPCIGGTATGTCCSATGWGWDSSREGAFEVCLEY